MVLLLLLVLMLMGAMMIAVLLLLLLHLLHLAEVLAEQVDRGVLLAAGVLVVGEPLLLVLRVSLAAVRSPGLDHAASRLGSLVSARCG